MKGEGAGGDRANQILGNTGLIGKPLRPQAKILRSLLLESGVASAASGAIVASILPVRHENRLGR
ncbi:MAG: hypothetical protein HC936_10580 [Leptolyngbyaceae cyanobacterium SU_3_3]|nr:hypothetical protein [Leptolyngbyaceae cyanobacterium SU_3_3]NJR53113.1 hypothetical protein [Leptolyngbyaceae cyanobacterium CSU_1_3]